MTPAEVGTARPPLAVERIEDGRVLRLRLDEPKGNILTGAMLRAIATALAEHRDDPRLRLVVLRGAGGNFSYGAAIEEHRPDRAADMLRALHGVARALGSYPVPVAALVEGRCLGGAFELVLCCALVFATEDARFACPEIKLGVFPPVLAAVGAARLGGPLAERLLLTGAELDAGAAARAGLLAGLIPAGADPEAALLEWYRAHLAGLSAFALREACAAVRERSPLVAALGDPLGDAERRYLERLVPSHDGNEGIEAFLARRPPVWRDA